MITDQTDHAYHVAILHRDDIHVPQSLNKHPAARQYTWLKRVS